MTAETNTADIQGAVVVVDAAAFKHVIETINRLMGFEDEETK